MITPARKMSYLRELSRASGSASLMPFLMASYRAEFWRSSTDVGHVCSNKSINSQHCLHNTASFTHTSQQHTLSSTSFTFAIFYKLTKSFSFLFSFSSWAFNHFCLVFNSRKQCTSKFIQNNQTCIIITALLVVFGKQTRFEATKNTGYCTATFSCQSV